MSKAVCQVTLDLKKKPSADKLVSASAKYYATQADCTAGKNMMLSQTRTLGTCYPTYVWTWHGGKNVTRGFDPNNRIKSVKFSKIQMSCAATTQANMYTDTKCSAFSQPFQFPGMKKGWSACNRTSQFKDASGNKLWTTEQCKEAPGPTRWEKDTSCQRLGSLNGVTTYQKVSFSCISGPPGPPASCPNLANIMKAKKRRPVLHDDR
jgi:hypothetical protein